MRMSPLIASGGDLRLRELHGGANSHSRFASVAVN
jgi:hypothetical protein